jgi:hypothetical protein
MANFDETAEGIEFVASGDARETSPEIMRAIAWLARDIAEAESVWDGAGLGVVCHLSDIWEIATGNGRDGDGSDLTWGAAGNRWFAGPLA